MLATTTAPRRSVESYSAPIEQSCPYCCTLIPLQAKKCSCCGEWVVRVTGGGAATVLRTLAWLWGGLTVLGGAGLWSVGQVARRWVLLHALDAELTPQLFDLLLYGVLVLLVLQGLSELIKRIAFVTDKGPDPVVRHDPAQAEKELAEEIRRLAEEKA